MCSRDVDLFEGVAVDVAVVVDVVVDAEGVAVDVAVDVDLVECVAVDVDGSLDGTDKQ